METRTVINTIKSLDKEGRIALAKSVRTDPDIWNAVNGIGDRSDDLINGGLKGIVKGDLKLLSDTEIRVTDEVNNWTARSDAGGVYELRLPPGIYRMNVVRNGYYETVINDVYIICDL